MVQDISRIKALMGHRLLVWYKRQSRPLPWRRTCDPYRIWISEIMLQQTQVDTVIPYYQRFVETFPDVETLADASLDQVLKAWENLGYYSRARHLHAAARMIMDTYGGKIPDTPDEIRTLPGIGPYSAGAILSIAYGQPLPAVDGNVRRILSRIFAIRKAIDDAGVQRNLYEIAETLVPAKHPGDFNQALMDLGATICRPKNPDCVRCPVATLCRARLAGLQNRLPIKRKAPGIPHRMAAVAVIQNSEGKLLIVQRPVSGLLASFWKLPGGFVDDAEEGKVGLKSRVREELGISIRVGKKLSSVDHVYTHFRITLHAYDCRLLKGAPKPIGCQAWCWASLADLQKLPLSKIDRMILAAI